MVGGKFTIESLDAFIDDFVENFLLGFPFDFEAGYVVEDFFHCRLMNVFHFDEALLQKHSQHSFVCLIIFNHIYYTHKLKKLIYRTLWLSSKKCVVYHHSHQRQNNSSHERKLFLQILYHILCIFFPFWLFLIFKFFKHF